MGVAPRVGRRVLEAGVIRVVVPSAASTAIVAAATCFRHIGRRAAHAIQPDRLQGRVDGRIDANARWRNAPVISPSPNLLLHRHVHLLA